MKKTLLKGILCFALIASASACSDTDEPGSGNGTGRIAPKVDIDTEVTTSRTSRVEATDISVKDLSVRLTSKEGKYNKKYDSVEDFPTDELFAIGDWDFEVMYGDESSEGFECPYFYGRQQIKVEEGKTTPVAVTAKLANSMVSIEYADNFTNYMSEYSAKLHSAGGTYIDYVQTETRPAYIKPGEVTITVSYTKPNGKGANINLPAFTAAACTHYHVKINLSEEAGTAILEVTFDDATTQEPIEIELNEEIENTDPPMLEVDGAAANQTIEFIPGFSKESVKVNIFARGTIDNITMTTSSKSLINQGWPAEIDLIAASDVQKETLAKLGLVTRGLSDTNAKMAVIDLTKVLNYIEYIDDSESKFTFTASVHENQCENPVTVTVKALPRVFEISNPTALPMGANKLSFDLKFNGGDPASLVKIKGSNDRGTLQELKATYVKQSEGNYRVTVTTPNDNYNINSLFAEVTTLKPEILSTNKLEIKRSNVVVSTTVDELDVYATHATLTAKVPNQSNDVDINTTTVLNKCNVYISTDGTNYKLASINKRDAATGTFEITGLTAGTKTYVKVALDKAQFDLNETNATEFTTEQALQIPNGNLDADVTIAENGDNWQNIVFQGGWGTNNYMTTISSNTSPLYAAYLPYVRSSGTVQTDDTHNKEGKAALLRTVGWGAGNTNVLGPGRVLHYIDPGMLHLGDIRKERPKKYQEDISGPLDTEDLNCGIKFASRPSTLKFWYKYIPKNQGDNGEAYIIIKDKDGKVLAENKINLYAQSTYKETTLQLSYKVKAKAAYIYIRFLSTNVDKALKKDSAWINFARECFGSQLYIDDIELTY